MPMENSSDHDLLIALNTKMEMLLAGQQQYILQWGKLLERMTAMEIQQGKNVTEIETIQQEITDLRKKFTLVDVLNAALAGAAGIAAILIGQK